MSNSVQQEKKQNMTFNSLSANPTKWSSIMITENGCTFLLSQCLIYMEVLEISVILNFELLCILMFEKYRDKYNKHTHFFFSCSRSTSLKYLFAEFEQYILKNLTELPPSIFDKLIKYSKFQNLIQSVSLTSIIGTSLIFANLLILYQWQNDYQKFHNLVFLSQH